jgi:hypothetical protein
MRRMQEVGGEMRPRIDLNQEIAEIDPGESGRNLLG